MNLVSSLWKIKNPQTKIVYTRTQHKFIRKFCEELFVKYFRPLSGQVVTHSPAALIIQVQAWVREIYSDLDDHSNGGTVSLGPIPNGT